MGKDRARHSNTTFLSIILLVTAGFSVYLNSLDGEFLWDDEVLVKDNPYIRSCSKLNKLLTQDIGSGAGMDYGFYRPLQMLTYSVDYSFWKLDPKGYHLTNIACHILTAILIYWLISILFSNNLLALITSLLFVVHPVHTEAVTYISGRAEPLSAIFILLAFISYLKCLRSGSRIACLMAAISYFFALLSKEYSLILPLLLLLYHYSFKVRIRLKYFLPFLVILSLYILLRLSLFGSLLPAITFKDTLLQRLPGCLVALFDYLRLLVLPFNLHMEYGYKWFRFNEPKAILGFLLLIWILFLMLRRKASNGLISFSAGWFLLTLLPQSNLFPINAYIAEHWLYLPSVGFFILLAYSLAYLYNNGLRVLMIFVLLSILTFYSYLTVRQNIYWKEPLLFYERALRYAPDSPRVLNNLAKSYQAVGRNQEAVELYNKAIKIYPSYADAYCNLGIVYTKLRKRKEAVPFFNKAIEINPSNVKAYNNLGSIYKEFGNYKEAISLYEKVIEIDSYYLGAYYNLGIIYAEIGEKEKAIIKFKKAIEFDPNNPLIYNNLGNLYKELGRPEEAVSSYRKAVELKPEYSYAYNNLGIVLSIAFDREEEAITAFIKAIEFSPDFADAHYNLSVAYYRTRQYALAIKHCDKAVNLGYKVNPEFLKLLEPFKREWGQVSIKIGSGLNNQQNR